MASRHSWSVVILCQVNVAFNALEYTWMILLDSGVLFMYNISRKFDAKQKHMSLQEGVIAAFDGLDNQAKEVQVHLWQKKMPALSRSTW